MVNLALLLIYLLLMLQHSVGVYLNALALTDPKLNIIKMCQILLTFITIFPLLVTDIMVVVGICQRENNSLINASQYYEPFIILYFTCIFINLNNIKIASLLKGLAKEYHLSLIKFIYLKTFTGLVLFFTGYSLCDLGKKLNYISLFSALYYCFNSIGNCIFLILAKIKMNHLKIMGANKDMVIPFNSSHHHDSDHGKSQDLAASNHEVQTRRNSRELVRGAVELFVRRYSNDSNASGSGLSMIAVRYLDDNAEREKKVTGNMDHAFIEIHGALQDGFIVNSIAIIMVIVVLASFWDGSPRSGCIVSVPWKFAIGFGNVVIARAHLKIGKLRII